MEITTALYAIIIIGKCYKLIIRDSAFRKKRRMQINQIKELYDYNHWANERLWQTVADLSLDQLTIDMHNGIGNILTTLLHMVNGVYLWRTHWQGTMLTHKLQIEDFPTLQLIRLRWQGEEGHVQRFLIMHHTEDLNRNIQYIRSSAPDEVLTQPLWKTMLHLINHQTQHRSEIAMQLTALNHSPGELGMNDFFNR
jgi:uncharacterized damage-inducible protein DinB